MNVVVALNDGSKIYPSYAPEHESDVLSFYATKVIAGEIQGYVITYDDGRVKAQGQVL